MHAILNNCSSLVKVTYTDGYNTVSVRESGTLSLAHLSVKEYLISERISKNSPLPYYHLDVKFANSAISCDCLLYLLQFPTAACSCNEIEASTSFGRYAAEFWITHARSNDGVIQNHVQEWVMKLLSSSVVHFHNWIRLFDVDQGGSDFFMRTIEDEPRPLYYASLLGLGQIVRELALGSPADVDMVGGFDGSALASALAGGHKEVVQILLENGADVNIAGGFYGSPLASASANGHKELVQILLKKGANVNLGGGFSGSALRLGFAKLFKGGIKSEDYSNMSEELQYKLTEGLANAHLETMQILLGNGANENMAGGYYGSALASASAGGHQEVVQILLKNGAKVNMAGGFYGSTLASASTRGHKEVVHILLENGADVNMAGGYYGSALASASADGHEGIVQILLQNGANVNMAGGYHGSALASASNRGHEEVVQILLKNGADEKIGTFSDHVYLAYGPGEDSDFEHWKRVRYTT